jgi:transcriptional regulator with XRE-family HTH domain
MSMRGACRVPRSSPPDPALAATLRRMRVERGITQEALAVRCGITPCALARIELAQAVPGWNTVRRIATGLDVGMVELCAAVEGRSPAAISSRA